MFKLYHLLLLLPLAVLLAPIKTSKKYQDKVDKTEALKKEKEKNKTITNEQKQVWCPSCGGTDHSHSSNKLYPMNKSKTKPPWPQFCCGLNTPSLVPFSEFTNNPSPTVKRDSSEQTTLSHCSWVQSTWSKAQRSLLFLFASVRDGLCAAKYYLKPISRR